MAGLETYLIPIVIGIIAHPAMAGWVDSGIPLVPPLCIALTAIIIFVIIKNTRPAEAERVLLFMLLCSMPFYSIHQHNTYKTMLLFQFLCRNIRDDNFRLASEQHLYRGQNPSGLI